MASKSRVKTYAARLACVLLLGALGAQGADWSTLTPQGYVSDFANVIDPASKTQIERYAEQMKAKTGVEMAFVTLTTLDGEPPEDVANTLYRKWGIGNKQTNEGVLLLLSIRDRRSRLEVGYGLEPILPDGSAGAVLRAMRPALRENHYGDAMILGARTIGERILAAKGVAADALNAPEPIRRRSRPSQLEGLWPFGLMVVLFLVFGFFSRRRGGGGGGWGGPPFIGPFPGGGWGSGSSGGFGGGGGGGSSWGGFGGGDSGGGGASSDW